QGVVEIMPQFSPLLLNEIQKLVHVTSYVTAQTKMRKGKVQYERTIQSLPTGTISAKSRVPHLGVSNSFEEWVEYITDWTQGELAEGSDANEQPNNEIQPDNFYDPELPASDVNEDDEPAYEGD